MSSSTTDGGGSSNEAATQRLRAAIERWIEATDDNAAMTVKRADVAARSVEVALADPDEGPVFAITCATDFPQGELSISTENAKLQAEWLLHMMEYMDRKRTVDQVLVEAAKFYLENVEAAEQDEEDDDDFGWFDKKDAKKPAASATTVVAKTGPQLRAEDFFTAGGSKAATERLLKDLGNIRASNSNQFGYEASPIDSNLYLWAVKLFDFPKEGLGGDLAEYSRRNKGGNHEYVYLEAKFPSDYPFAPPFIRVVRPRFQFHTGHVTIGGSICMELLTRSGWTPGNDIESILVQIRSEMMAGGARLDKGNQAEYTESEAQEAFKRVARQHGWEK